MSPTLAIPSLSNTNCPSLVPSYSLAVNPANSPAPSPATAPSLNIIVLSFVYTCSA